MSGALPCGTGLGAPEGAEPCGIGATPAIPSADVSRVFAAIEKSFDGTWMSNGVAAILLHDNLPEVFGHEEWSDWMFKPANGAFEWAHSQRLLAPVHPDKWMFTPLGKAVCAAAQSEDRAERGGGQ
jgi:hypothetical protein